MKNLRLIKVVTGACLTACLFFISCGNEDEAVVGNLPVADAGQDMTAVVGSTVTLDGSQSSDADGDNLSFRWELRETPSGSNAEINPANQAEVSFIPDVAGSYVARVFVNDGNNPPQTDDVTIDVSESIGSAPVANITDENGDVFSQENENNIIPTNTPVELSGATSSDPDFDALSYEWSLLDGPDGNNASFSDADQARTEFTADIEGEYRIELSVDDGNGNVDTEEVLLTAEIQPIIISSGISSNTTWADVYDDPEQPDYRVTRLISISSGATLTIEPGVIVEFESDRGIDVNGALVAEGTSTDSIKFTGTTKEKGFWRGIAIYSPNVNNLFSYTTVEYGGSSEIGFGIPRANVGVEAGDRLKVNNSTFRGSTGYGLFFERGSILEEFAENSFSDNDAFPLGLPVNNVGALDRQSTFSSNGTDEVAIFGSTLNQPNEVEWKSFDDNTSFRILGYLTINSGMLISEGVTMNFGSDVGLEVSGAGYLTARGTASNKITFTGATETPGFWKGLVFYNNNIQNELDHVIVSYGGSTEFGFGIPRVNVGVESGDRLSIRNSEIFGSADYGVYFELGSTLRAFSNNVIRDNVGLPIALSMANATMIDEASEFNVGNGDNSVNIIGNTFNEGTVESTLVALSNNTSYYLTGNLDISSGLVLADGVSIEVGIDNLIEVSGAGYLIANGTSSVGISITGKTKSPGQWKGIAIYNNNVQNLLNFVTVSHGGSSEQGFGIPKVNIGVEAGDRLTVTNCTITDCDGIGLFGEAGSTVTQSGNTFSNNSQGDVVLN